MSKIKEQIIDILKNYAEDTVVWTGKCSRGCCDEYEHYNLIPEEDYDDIANDIITLEED